MIERLETIEKKYNEINNELMNPEVLGDINKTLKLNKELAVIVFIAIRNTSEKFSVIINKLSISIFSKTNNRINNIIKPLDIIIEP